MSRSPNTELLLQTWDDNRLSDSLVRGIARLYRATFPASQRVDVAVLLANADLGRGLLCTAKRHGHLVGFTYSTPLADTTVHLLGYVAVDPACRGRGIGSRLVAFLRQRAADIGFRGFLIELESAAAPSNEQRLRFYRHAGARPVDCLPQYGPLDATDDSTPPTQLLWLSTGGATDSSQPTAALLRRCVLTILTHAHRLDEGDPRVARILSAIVC